MATDTAVAERAKPRTKAKKAPKPSGDASVASDTAPILTADAKAAGVKAKGKGATTADSLTAYRTHGAGEVSGPTP